MDDKISQKEEETDRKVQLCPKHVIYEHVEIEEEMSSTKSQSSIEKSECRWGVCNKSMIDLQRHIIKKHLCIHAFSCPYKFCRATNSTSPKSMKELEEHVRKFHSNSANGVNLLPLSIPSPFNVQSSKLPPPPPLPTTVPLYKTQIDPILMKKRGKNDPRLTKSKKVIIAPKKSEKRSSKGKSINYPMLTSSFIINFNNGKSARSSTIEKEEDQENSKLMDLCSDYEKLGLDRKRKLKEDDLEGNEEKKGDRELKVKDEKDSFKNGMYIKRDERKSNKKDSMQPPPPKKKRKSIKNERS